MVPEAALNHAGQNFSLRADLADPEFLQDRMQRISSEDAQYIRPLLL